MAWIKVDIASEIRTFFASLQLQEWGYRCCSFSPLPLIQFNSSPLMVIHQKYRLMPPICDLLYHLQFCFMCHFWTLLNDERYSRYFPDALIFREFRSFFPSIYWNSLQCCAITFKMCSLTSNKQRNYFWISISIHYYQIFFHLWLFAWNRSLKHLHITWGGPKSVFTNWMRSHRWEKAKRGDIVIDRLACYMVYIRCAVGFSKNSQ